MYFSEELHREKQVTTPKQAKFEAREIELAKKLIETLAAPFKPEQFHDEYKQNVEKLIETKRKGGKVTPIRQPKIPPVIDLMQALQQSLAKNAKTGKQAGGKTPRKRAASVA